MQVGDKVRVLRSGTWPPGTVVEVDRFDAHCDPVFSDGLVKGWMGPAQYEFIPDVRDVPAEVVGQPAEQLLRLFASLTHRIDAYERDHGRRSATLDREKRDILKREILRRCGGL